MALDLAYRVAAGKYGCCISMGCVLRSDGRFSVAAGEPGRKLDYDVCDLGAGQRWFILMTFSCSEMGGVVMLVVGRVCMPYVVRSVEKRNGTKDAEELKKRLRVQVSMTTFLVVVVNKMLSADGIDNYGHDHDCEFGSESSSKARAAVA